MSSPSEAEATVLALSTKLEEDFVSPLTAVRSALETMRDYQDMSAEERIRFIDTALAACARLQTGVVHLSEAVYGTTDAGAGEVADTDADGYAERITVHRGLGIIELDFSEYEFRSPDAVNEFYDVIDRIVIATGHKWFFAVNFRNTKIWPEAWVTFAHRGKKVTVAFGTGHIRFADPPESPGTPDPLPTREAAFAAIRDQLR